MIEFERQIREAISAARSGTGMSGTTEQGATVGQVARNVATLAIGARAIQQVMTSRGQDTEGNAAIDMSNPVNLNKPVNTNNPVNINNPVNVSNPVNAGNSVSGANSPAPQAQDSYARFAHEAHRAAAELQRTSSGQDQDLALNAGAEFNPSLISRPGLINGSWNNPIILAAMPLLLLVERWRGKQGNQAMAIRAQVVRELQYFQQTLLKQQMLPDDVSRLSYLLCSYIDEVFYAFQASHSSSPSLLVEFHFDAFGGEACFDDLHAYMNSPGLNRDILGLYDVILSLGFEGKFRMIERGNVLLGDLRNRLNAILYNQNATQSLNLTVAAPVAPQIKRYRPIKVFLYGFALCLLAYGASAWYLHEQSLQIRNAIAAWEPPVPRKINLMETLPQPLPKILAEGWLEVREDPRGWLLIFTSDGAFATGKAQLSPEFVQKQNIERLGQALAPWPGDLEVIGHTDNQPFRNASASAATLANMKLSEARANTVAEKLREVINANSTITREVTALGRGDSEPLADNRTEDGRRRNRRVDILWKIGQRGSTKALEDYANSNKTTGNPDPSSSTAH